MPRINEHSFELDNSIYKLTYYRHDKPILYINGILFTGNKSAMLIKYITQNNLPLNLFKGQTTQQLSDLVLKHFSEGNNLEILDKKSSYESESIKGAKEGSSKLTEPKDNTRPGEKIEDIINSLDWDKIKDKKKNKLLIIGCCDAKSWQPNDLHNGEYVNYDFGKSLDDLRKSRLDFYKDKLPDSYFNKKKRKGETVDRDYFNRSLNSNNRRKALEVYGSKGSPFYNPEMIKLYEYNIDNSNLHLLIISGLYGIIKHDDYINDYHLEIGRGGKKWADNQIQEVVKKYIEDNKIENVFYSLSDNYKPFLNPINNWLNLWFDHVGRGFDQATDLKKFLSEL
jgi:hypothetical protein